MRKRHVLNQISKYNFDNTEPINDVSINVAKGGIWGWILGEKNSMTADTAKLISLSNSIRNYVSNIISNSGLCPDNFYQSLCKLIKEYSYIADMSVIQHWNQICNSEEKETLKKFKVYKKAYSEFCIDNLYTVTPELPNQVSSKEQWIYFRDKLALFTENKVKKEKNNSTETSIIDKLEYVNNRLSIRDATLINKCLEMITEGSVTKELIRISREQVTKKVLEEITKIICLKIGKDQWNNKPKERIYIKDLYNNIVDFEPFDINATEDQQLIAIAAILQKGEDYKSLIRYSEDNKINDYRYILTLWGALEGYASLPKILFSQYMISQNVCNTNKILGLSNIESPFPISSKESSDKVHPSTNLDSDGTNENINLIISELIVDCPSTKNDKIYYTKILQQYGLTEKALKEIELSTFLNKGKKAPKKVLTWFTKKIKDEYTNIKFPNLDNQEAVFSGIFLKDYNYLINDKRFIDYVGTHSDWQRDLKWFIEAHRPGSQYPHYQNKPTDNQSVIAQFEHLKDGKYKNSIPYLKKLYKIVF